MPPHMRKFSLAFVLLGLLLIFVFHLTAIDTAVSRWFYQDGAWVGPESDFLRLFYFPGNALLFFLPSFLATASLLLSFSSRPAFTVFRSHRRHAILVLLSMVIFSGLINGFLLKGLFARPRPGAYFAADACYVGPFEVGSPTGGRFASSFPCGHCSTPFAWFAFYFAALNRKGRAAAWVRKLLGLAVPLLAGSVMVVSRIAYGAHYLSDAIYAGVFMFLMITAAAWLLDLDTRNHRIDAQKNPLKSFGAVELLMATASLALAAIPYLYILNETKGLTGI